MYYSNVCGIRVTICSVNISRGPRATPLGQRRRPGRPGSLTMTSTLFTPIQRFFFYPPFRPLRDDTKHVVIYHKRLRSHRQIFLPDYYPNWVVEFFLL